VLWTVIAVLAALALTGVVLFKLRRFRAEKKTPPYTAMANGAEKVPAISRPREPQVERVAVAALEPAPTPEPERQPEPCQVLRELHTGAEILPEPQPPAPCTGDADFPRWVHDDRLYKERLGEWREQQAHKLRHPELVRLRHMERSRMTRSQAIIKRIAQIETQLGPFDDFSEIYFRRIMEALDSVRLNMARDKVLGDAKKQHAGQPVA
jgi:hypothetical protein